MPLRRSFPPPDSSIRGAPRTCHSHLAESKASACASRLQRCDLYLLLHSLSQNTPLKNVLLDVHGLSAIRRAYLSEERAQTAEEGHVQVCAPAQGWSRRGRRLWVMEVLLSARAGKLSCERLRQQQRAAEGKGRVGSGTVSPRPQSSSQGDG